jgi:hypothetical protein
MTGHRTIDRTEHTRKLGCCTGEEFKLKYLRMSNYRKGIKMV